MSEEGTAPLGDGSVTRDDVVRVLTIKGYVTRRPAGARPGGEQR